MDHQSHGGSHRSGCVVFVYYEENTYIYESRCNERLKPKTQGSTRLTYTGLYGGLEHLKIETRLRGERFEGVKGE